MSADATAAPTAAADESVVRFPLILTATSINVLALAIPIAVSLVFNRVVPNPGTATLGVVVALVIVAALFEALLRFCRSYLLAYAGARYTWRSTYEAINHILRVPLGRSGTDTATGLEYLTAIAHTRDRHNGQLIVSICDLVFLPLIVIAICLISLEAAGLMAIILAGYAALIAVQAERLVKAADAQSAEADQRYKFLFDVLSAASTVKSLAVEDQMVRRYEERQSRLVGQSNAVSALTGRLISFTVVGGQVIVAAMLIYGALAVSGGRMTLGDVSALVLLGGRIMPPVQRAIFTLVQMRSVRQAEAKIAALHAIPADAEPVEGLDVRLDGAISLEGVTYQSGGKLLLDDADLHISPGETVVISANRRAAATCLLQIMAGIIRPDAGEVQLNGVAPYTYPSELRNRAVGYLSRDATLFRGTLRDNITRFGEVPVHEAMEIAGMLRVDTVINQLPRGLDTQINWSTTEEISPGLRQIIALTRALGTRPRVLLLDNLGQGLDKETYENIYRFISKISGQATIVIASDDANLRTLASRHYTLIDGKLMPSSTVSTTNLQSYSNIRL